MDKFDLPFAYKGKQLCVSLTLGIACFPGDGNSEESLLANAESAMQRAKRNSLPYQYFDPVNDVSPAQQLRYSGQIRSALDNDEFELVYQPLVTLDSSRITGAEALLRWKHPVEGTVMPERIIPVAEQLGMITPITNWVLVTALKQCRQWAFGGCDIPVSVNVSARSFQNPRLLEKIQWALQEAAVDGNRLVIEITEATLMQDIDRATELLSNLSEAGVTIAIDDFGTGYSSLSYLKRLPIDTLKIDQSFVTDVAFDQQDIPSSVPSSTLATTSVTRWLPRAWKTASPWMHWTSSVAILPRVSTSANRWRTNTSPPCWDRPPTSPEQPVAGPGAGKHSQLASAIPNCQKCDVSPFVWKISVRLIITN